MQKAVPNNIPARLVTPFAIVVRLGCLLALLLSGSSAWAQTSKTIPGVAPAGYPDFATAIGDINGVSRRVG